MQHPAADGAGQGDVVLCDFLGGLFSAVDIVERVSPTILARPNLMKQMGTDPGMMKMKVRSIRFQRTWMAQYSKQSASLVATLQAPVTLRSIRSQ